MLTGRPLTVKNTRFSPTGVRLMGYFFQHPPFRTRLQSMLKQARKLAFLFQKFCGPSLLKIPAFSLPFTLQIRKWQHILPNFGRFIMQWHKLLKRIFQIHRDQLFLTVPLTVIWLQEQKFKSNLRFLLLKKPKVW